MKKFPAVLIGGLAVMLLTIVLYFTILSNIILTAIHFISLVAILLSEGITTFYLWRAKGSPRGIAAAVVSVIRLVIRILALGDLYRSMDPDNGTLFLVLSILFPVTEAFFLFFNRKKELGMPPRREKPPVEEPVWHQETFGDF